MKYKGIEFEAIVATPGVGKSYLCDRHPEKFVDADEVRLKTKYYVPENITRAELESTKGDRTFKIRYEGEDFINELYKKLKKDVTNGKILICSPHPELISFLKINDIKFCLVYPSKDIKEEIKRRMKVRGNGAKMIDNNYNLFEKFYEQNSTETDSAIKYEFTKNEYLENIIKDKFNLKF